MNNCKIRTDNFPTFLFYKKSRGCFLLEALEERSIQLGSSWLEFRGHVFLQMASGYLYFENFSNSAASNVIETWNPFNEYENADYKSRNSFYNFKNEKKRQAISLNVAM